MADDRPGARRARHNGNGDRHGFAPRRSYGDGQRRSYGERDGGERRSYGRSGERTGGSRTGRFSRDDRRDSRPPQRQRVPEPRVPEDVVPQDLEPSARRELRALGRANAENVARHLVMVQRLLDTDPELAYQHARYAASHAGRIAVVRESAGIAAYLSGHYVEALRDIRAARRLSGLDLHRAIEADCERALGHLGRALKAAAEADPSQLDDTEEAEIAMVVSGVRHEMGETELGLVVIEEAIMMFRGDRETRRRLHSVRADRLEELGRLEEAQVVRERIGQGPEDLPEDVAVYDMEDESEVTGAEVTGEPGASAGAPSHEPAEGTAADPEDARDDDGGAGTDEVLDNEDESWTGSFAQRVEAEMAELLGEEVADTSSTDASSTDAPSTAARGSDED